MSIAAADSPFNGTQTGTFTGPHGATGTFSRTVADQNGVRATAATFTLASGKTVTRDDTLTKTATGYSNSATTTFADGKTARAQTTGTIVAPGTIAITGTLDARTGAAETISGTRTAAGTDLAFTNGAGQTRSLDSRTVSDGNRTTATFSGTTFGGVAFSGQDALTILQSQTSAA